MLCVHQLLVFLLVEMDMPLKCIAADGEDIS